MYTTFTNFLVSHGITHRVSCPHSHRQNGIAKRKQRHMVENGITLLAKSSLGFEWRLEQLRIFITGFQL